MNAQEREQLSSFLQQLTQAQANQKDPEADALIREASVRQPDASYLLVQRAMQLEYALQAMKSQISQIQAELAQARAGSQSSFLDSANAWGKQPAAPAQSAAIQPRAQAAAPAPSPAPAAAPSSSWGAGILGNVATTAAGVVAGSFLFQGIENLMGHHNQGGFGKNSPSADAAPAPAENTVINNYYDGSGPDDAVDVADAGTDSGGDDSA
jgi:hypothetical protein